MAGAIRITNTASPGDDNKTIQYNNDGYFGGAAQLFWDKVNNRLGIGDNTPAQQLSLTKSMELLETTASDIGVIYKGANRFLHTYHATGAQGYNIFLGNNAGNFSMAISGSDFHASYNIAIGENVLSALTTGYSNCGLGVNALRTLTTGYGNLGMGIHTLEENITGCINVAIGNRAGQGTNGHSFSNNVLVGFAAGRFLANGGDNNILIGYQAGDNVTSGEKNIIIGYDLNALAAAGDSQLNIGSLIFGNLGATKRVGINTSTMNETLNVGGAIRLGTSALTNAGTIRWNGTNFQGYKGAAWVNLDGGGGGGFSDGGEAGGAARTLGNTDNYHLGFKTNDTVRLHINNDGSIGINKITPLGCKLDIDGNFRAWYTKAGSAIMEVCGTHRMLVTGSSLVTDFFASWAINVGPTSSGATRNVVGMEINVQESESDQGLKGQRTGKSSTILQIVPESQFDGRSGYNVSFGIMFGRGGHTGNPRMHVGVVAEQYAIVHNGAFMLLHGGNGAGDRPSAAMDLRDNWLCGIDTAAATLSYAFRTGNSQPFVSRNAADNATYILIGMATDNQILVGYACANYINLGQSSGSSNPIRIRVGGVNDKTILVGAADSGGAGYRMLRVGN
jgi:hypothetical protein